MKRLSAIIAALLISLTVSIPVYAEPSEAVSDEASAQQSEVSAEEKSETEESKAEESTAEESKAEESTTEESTAEESKTEESTAEESTTEESKNEESTAEESKTEESTAEESKTEESTTEESKTEEKEVFKSYRIEEAGMDISLPKDMYVVTKNTDPKDPAFEAYKLTKEQMMKNLDEMHVLLKADTKDFVNDITVSVFENKDTKNIGDLSKLSESKLQRVIDNLLEQSIYKGCVKSEYNNTVFLTLNVEDKANNTNINGIQQYTVVNGKRVIITFQSFDGKLDDFETALFDGIMQKVKFDGADAKPSKTVSDNVKEKSDKENTGNAGNIIDIRYIYMVIAAAIGVISLVIMIAAAKSYKKTKLRLSEGDKGDSEDNDRSEDESKADTDEKDDNTEEKDSEDKPDQEEETAVVTEDETDNVTDDSDTNETEEIKDINDEAVTVSLIDAYISEEDNTSEKDTSTDKEEYVPESEKHDEPEIPVEENSVIPADYEEQKDEPEETVKTDTAPVSAEPERYIKPSGRSSTTFSNNNEKPTEQAFTALLDRLKESSTYVDDDESGSKKKASSDLNGAEPESENIELEISKSADGSLIIGALSGSGKPVDVDIKDSADLKAERIKKMKELGLENPYQNEIYNRRDAAVKDGFTVKAKDMKADKKTKADTGISKSKPDVNALAGAAAAVSSVSTLFGKTDNTKADEALTESAIFAAKDNDAVKGVPLKKRTIIIKDKTADAGKNKRSDKEMMDRDSDIIYEVAPKPRQEIKPLKSDFTNIPRLENVKADEYNSQYDEMKKSMPKNQAYTQKFNSVQAVRTKSQETVKPNEEKEPETDEVKPVNTEPSTEPVTKTDNEPKTESKIEPKEETKPEQTQENNEEMDESEIIKFYTGYDDGTEDNKYQDKEIVIKDHKKKTESLSFGDRIKRSLGRFFSGETPEDEEEDEDL